MNFELAIIGTPSAIKRTITKISLRMQGLGCSFDQSYTQRHDWRLSKKEALALSCIHLRINVVVSDTIHRGQIRIFLKTVGGMAWVYPMCHECLKHTDWDKHQTKLLATLAH